MSTTNDSGFKALLAAQLIPEGSRVKLSAGQFDIAGLTDMNIGTALHTAAAGAYLTCRLLTAPGSFFMIASGAISAGTQLFPAASGKVAGSGTTALGIVNLEAATANGDLIECTLCQKGA